MKRCEWLWGAWGVLMDEMWAGIPNHPLRESIWVLAQLINVSLTRIPGAWRDVTVPPGLPAKPTPDTAGLRVIARVLRATGSRGSGHADPRRFAAALCESLAGVWDSLAPTVAKVTAA